MKNIITQNYIFLSAIAYPALENKRKLTPHFWSFGAISGAGFML